VFHGTLISFLEVNFSQLLMFEISFFLKQKIVEVSKVVVHNDDVTHGVQLMLMSTYKYCEPWSS
jgi:hypothetical protein